MQLNRLLFLLCVVCTLCVIINCQEDVDRRDLHRIILKPEKSKKSKKRAKPIKSKPFRPHQHVNSFEDIIFEPSGLASSNRYLQYQHRPHYDNHHNEYHDLIKPKPPRPDSTELTYPEETVHVQQSASTTEQNYVPFQPNTDWNPIPSTQLTHDYRPRDHDQRGASATRDTVSSGATKNKHNKRRKKARRTTTRSPVVFLTSTTYTPPTFWTTTAQPTTRPLTYLHNFPATQTQETKLKPKIPLHQQHHYVNYNHNNQSHIRYEVSAGIRSNAVKTAPSTGRYAHAPVVTTTVPTRGYHNIHHNSDTKLAVSNLENSYEVVERGKDYNKQIKQSSFKGTLVPQPVYPPLQPFLPTVSTYSNGAKPKKTTAAQRGFGKKRIGPRVSDTGVEQQRNVHLTDAQW